MLLLGPQEGMHSVDIAKEIKTYEFYFKKTDHLLMESKLDHVKITIKIFCLPDNMIKFKIENKLYIPK